MLLHHYLENYARNTPDAPCFSLEDIELTYGEFDSQVNQLANSFIELGVKPGQRVAILGENSIEHCVMFYAAFKVGAVSVPLNYRLAPEELAFVINDANTQVLVVLDGLATTLDALRPALPDDLRLITRSLPDSLHWSELLARHSTTRPAVDVQWEAPCLQLYTSGTTGNPKGVVLSHRNLIQGCSVVSLSVPTRLAQGSATIVAAPMFHISGAGSTILGIYHGQHILLHPGFDPIKIVETVETHPVTSLFMVPAMINLVLQIPGIEDRDFSRLDTISYGASPMSESLLKKAMDVFQCKFFQAYGMTETAGSGTMLTAEDHARALAGKPELLRSVGRPLAGGEIKVMDTAGNEVPTGEIGEIRIKCDANMMEYYNLPEATAKELTDGWVHTGDAGYLDEEGYLYLKDRIKDMVISGGENIYPVEVENTLAKIEGVVDVAVIGVPDDKFGEALLAFVVLKEGASLTVEELIAFCRDKIAGYKIPRQLELVSELLVTRQGRSSRKYCGNPIGRKHR